MRIILAAAAAAVLLCSGCASVTQGTTHNLRIDTQTRQGEDVRGADCRLTNDHGTTVVRSGQTAPVRRSSKDLEIACTANGHKDATARLVSRANAGLAGNIIIGGAIGAMVDHSSGAAYTYPSWVRLVFGDHLMADRKDEIDGVAMGARPPTSVTTADRTRPPAAAAAQATPVALPPAQALGPPPSAFVYSITDRNTRASQSVTVGPVHDVRALGELGIVTPADGWGPVAEQAGRSRRNYTSPVAPTRLFELDFDAGGEEEMQVDGRPVRTMRIGISGWTVLTNSFSPVRAPYAGAAWYAPELQRVVRFEARARGAVGSTALLVDESLELVGVQRAPGASPMVAAAPAQQAAATTRPFETHEYRIVDRNTGAAQTVVLSLDRVLPEGRSFNAGARVEGPDGQPAMMKSALVGELDLVTPPGGWADIAASGRPGFRYDSRVQGARRSYQLDFYVGGDQDIQVGNVSVPAVRIVMNGWVTQAGAGSTPTPVPYSATAWYAPGLQRVVRFEAKARSSTPYVNVSVDETSELVASSALRPAPAAAVAAVTAAPAAAAAPVAAVPAPASAAGARAHESYEYRITDRRSGGARVATLQVEAVGTGAKTFNGGQRVESAAGEPLLMQAALTGELDFATPPGGWAALAQKPRSRLKFSSMVSSARREYELDFEVGREEDVQVAGLPLRVQRIQMEGWLTTATGASPGRARYSGAAWYAPALKRVVRFEGKSLAVDEMLELVAFSLRRD